MLSVGKQTVSDEVLSRLMSDIENKTLKLGDKIPSEKELCEKYNVSRVSVRSAIQKLQAQSFVRTYPGKGTYVISDTVQNAGIMGQIEMSREEYLYFIELRQALEFKSVELMAQRGTKQDLEELHEALLQMEKSASNSVSYTDADLRFHIALIRGSQNKLFYQIFMSCRDGFWNYLWEMNRLIKNQSRSLQNHQNIYAALMRKDGAAARKIIERTLEDNLEKFYGALTTEGN